MRITVVERRPGSSGEIFSRLHGQDIVPSVPGEVFVNWGTSPYNFWLENRIQYDQYCPQSFVLNRPYCVANCADKVTMIEKLRSKGIYTPRILGVGFNAVIKRRHHRGGYGMKILERDCYIEEFVSTDKEYRVDVIDTRVLVREKREGQGLIRNRRNGWKFFIARQYPPELPDLAIRAVKALSLDFGACDIGLTWHDQLVVFEVNSAPRITAPTATEWWVGNLLEYIEQRIREGRWVE